MREREREKMARGGSSAAVGQVGHRRPGRLRDEGEQPASSGSGSSPAARAARGGECDLSRKRASRCPSARKNACLSPPLGGPCQADAAAVWWPSLLWPTKERCRVPASRQVTDCGVPRLAGQARSANASCRTGADALRTAKNVYRDALPHASPIGEREAATAKKTSVAPR